MSVLSTVFILLTPTFRSGHISWGDTACMSQTTRVAASALCVVTISTALGIGYIHRSQTEEKQRLHQGVIRDEELLRRKELEFSGGRNAGEHAPNERRE